MITLHEGVLYAPSFYLSSGAHMWNGEERRALPLSEDQLEKIAEMAAEKALEKVYSEVGRSLVKKIFWIVGAGAVAILWWMGKIGAPLK